jgi:hypothetical protein
MEFPITDVGKLPVILTMAEVSAIYRLSKRTIQRQLQVNEFRPLPFDKYPYRWLRDDVVRDLQARRVKQKMRRHGFATTKTKRDADLITK